MEPTPSPDEHATEREARRALRDRNVLRALGLLLSAVTALLGVGLFAHTRRLGETATGTVGFGARLAEAGPALGEALAVVLLWTCAVMAVASACLALLARPWQIAIHFGVAAGFAALAFSVAGALAYAALG